MVTVCIPAFNCDVKKLARDLLFQLKDAGKDAEIIIIDDGSENRFKSQYNELKDERIRVILFDKNMGRAATRNRFLPYSRNEYLLFLDCDSEIVDEKFLQNYFFSIQTGVKVVCGGRIYPPRPADKKYALHWKYGKYRESRSAEHRKRDSNQSFMTNNFLIKKDIFERFQFNEELKNYGHEDTLLGFQLMQAGVEIDHIDNAIVHGALATNKELLEKTKSAISNLEYILKLLNNDKKFIDSVHLLRSYFRLKRYGLIFFLRLIVRPGCWILESFLQRGVVNLKLFSFYKLLLFARYRTKFHPIKVNTII